jgi:hypothetical protein
LAGIITCEESDGSSLGASATGSADTMYVIFGVVWEVIVDDRLDIFHVCKKVSQVHKFSFSTTIGS